MQVFCVLSETATGRKQQQIQGTDEDIIRVSADAEQNELQLSPQCIRYTVCLE